jgi:two-component system chemotaxis response regulator CheY
MHNKEGSIDWQSLQVLIADDQRLALDTLQDMLAELGITKIYAAKSGVEALKFADAFGDTIRVFICDWNMPGLTGMGLLEKLRGALVSTPFLMVTGRSDVGSIIDAKKSGVTGYILKPFSLAELRDKITKVLTELVE